ncbi:MAG: hypothetical protein MJ093_00915 [Saccharofermentans sp.]|nr:hypothetical protein [Saccharofermentans sp.]
MGQKKVFGKLIAKECLFMLLLILVACVAALIQSLFKVYAGEYSSFIFSGTNYKYNRIMYVIGLFIFLAGLAGLYTKLLDKDFVKLSQLSLVQKIVSLALLVVWAFVMVVAEVMTMFSMVLGMSRNLIPEFWLYVTVFGWPVLTLVFLGLNSFKILKK